jgi:diadenosine tetraphosphate (Ap4A) HIT family hydrolase
LHKLEQDCWICQSLEKPDPLVYYESSVSRTKLNPDQLFKGYSFVTLKWHAEELYQLTDKERKSFLDDMSIVASALAKVLKPDKMNYELLGNGAPHMHWHIVPRYTTDPVWGRPIWSGSRGKKRLTREEYSHLVKQISSKIKE